MFVCSSCLWTYVREHVFEHVRGERMFANMQFWKQFCKIACSWTLFVSTYVCMFEGMFEACSYVRNVRVQQFCKTWCSWKHVCVLAVVHGRELKILQNVRESSKIYIYIYIHMYDNREETPCLRNQVVYPKIAEGSSRPATSCSEHMFSKDRNPRRYAKVTRRVTRS